MDNKQYNNRYEIPTCCFELDNKTHNLNSTIELIKYKLKFPVDGTIYDSSHIVFINSIWNYFETHFAHLLSQIRFILRENDNEYWDVPFSLKYSISESIVIETHILRAVVCVIWGDSGHTPFFADKKDLLIYYEKQLEKELGVENYSFDKEQIVTKWPLDNIPNLKKSEIARHLRPHGY